VTPLQRRYYGSGPICKVAFSADSGMVRSRGTLRAEVSTHCFLPTVRRVERLPSDRARQGARTAFAEVRRIRRDAAGFPSKMLTMSSSASSAANSPASVATSAISVVSRRPAGFRRHRRPICSSTRRSTSCVSKARNAVRRRADRRAPTA
jgi:hypothetical protein